VADEPDVDTLWREVQANVRGLQSASRLPGDAQLYDPRLEVVKAHLRLGHSGTAVSEAEKLARQNKAAGYIAYELLKEYHLAEGWPSSASTYAETAAKLLREAEKDHEKQRKKRKW
jgi:hypothetical protein